VIVVGVGEHHSPDRADARTRQRLAKHRPVCAHVHEHRLAGISNDDRIALPDVEHHDRAPYEPSGKR